MIYTIYALVDSRDNQPFYIGISKHAHIRRNAHSSSGVSGKHKNAVRIANIRRAGGKVIMMLVELVETLEQANEREWFWVSCYQTAGYQLTNARKINRTFDQPTAEIITRYPLVPMLSPAQYKYLYWFATSRYCYIDMGMRRYMIEKGVLIKNSTITGIEITPLGILTLERYAIYKTFVFGA